MTLALYVLSGKELGRVERFEQNQVLIGRGEGADLRLQSAGISREHARLIRKGPEVVQLIDLDSTSGTYLLDASGARTEADRIQQVVLSDGAMFRLANVELRLRIESLTPSSQGASEEPGDFGLELEGEWGEAAITPSASAPPAAPHAPAPVAKNPAPQRPGGKAAGGKAASELAKLKQQAASASQGNAGGKVLQYSRVDGEAGLGGGSLSDRPGWQRALIALFALLILGALAYGSFQLTQGLRDARSNPVESLD